MNERIVLLTGPPGAGKGTQARIFASRHGWYTFSIGQLLRDTVSPEIKKRMNEGDLLPKEHVVSLVIEEIDSHPGPVLVDGFPRRLDQAEEFDRVMKEKGRSEFTVLFMTVDEKESWNRIMDRKRADDKREVWEARWQEYYEHTVPAVEYYREKDNIVEVDGNVSIEEVAKAIEDRLINAP